MDPVKVRVGNHRKRLREAGMKPVQIWLPDPQAEGFASECRRQSAIVAADPDNLEDLLAVAEVSDWGDE